VHIPSNPMQPGPIYLKTPRKCGIFGVMCEGIPQQVNFLIDEAADTAKGANATISYVHYYLENHGLGETDAHFHTDNCSGQNKNNYFLWYFAWRTLTLLHNHILFSNCRPHQIWTRPMFWFNQEVLQSVLCFITL